MNFVEVLKYLGYGWLILVIAVVANAVARSLGWKTWYDYFYAISELGLKAATSSLTFMEILFLFIIYPGIFGLTIYLVLLFSLK